MISTGRLQILGKLEPLKIGQEHSPTSLPTLFSPTTSKVFSGPDTEHRSGGLKDLSGLCLSSAEWRI